MALNKARNATNATKNDISFLKLQKNTPAKQLKPKQKQHHTPKPQKQHQQQQSEKKPKHHQKQQQQKVKYNSQHQHQQQPLRKQQKLNHQPQQTPMRNNNNNHSYINKLKQPSYSQVAKHGNAPTPKTQAPSGPASRHLQLYREKLRANQQQTKEISQQFNQQQSNPNLTAMVEQNARLIALMGKKMDVLTDLIQVLLQNVNLPTKNLQQQHIEPTIMFAPPNPNNMSVESITEHTKTDNRRNSTLANETINYE